MMETGVNGLRDMLMNDIEQFMTTRSELMFNEADLQLNLAESLRHNGHYNNVWLEYYLHKGEIPEYNRLWPSHMRVDMVVRGGRYYVPIELKYKTASIGRNLPRFGQQLINVERCEVMKDMVARDLDLYDAWKDVRRLELLTGHFSNIPFGVFLMLTNNRGHMSPQRPTSNQYRFCMAEGRHDRHRVWLSPDTPSVRNMPGFDLDREYDIHWHPMPAMTDDANDRNKEFFYTLLII